MQSDSSNRLDPQFSKAPELVPSFTFHVSLAPIQHVGTIPIGYRRFFPISGGTITGPRFAGRILPGGGDWNLISSDGVTHMFAKYTVALPDDDGSETLVIVTNEGMSRSLAQATDQSSGPVSQTTNFDQSTQQGSEDQKVGESETQVVQKYIRTTPKFEVQTGSKYEFLTRSLWLGVMRPLERKDEVVIDFFEVC